MKEIWKSIDDFPNYEVSTMGNVRNCTTGTVLRPLLRGGYLSVALYRNRVQHRRSIHRLVLAAFAGPAPKGHWGHHKNATRTDNRFENLEWVTPQRNTTAAFEAGNRATGEKHHKAKLTEDDVRAIRAMGWENTNNPHKKISLPKIAAMYGVSHPNIQAILRRETWKDVA